MTNAPPGSTLKNILSNGLLSVFSVVLLFATLEIGARGLQFLDLLPVLTKDSIDPNADCASRSGCVGPVLVKSENPVMFFELRGSDPAINSFKMRDREYTIEAPADTRRIVVMGDSVTFGHGLPLGESYTKQLERLLNAAPDIAGKVEVMNFGVPAFSTRAELEFFRVTARQFKPDVVVVAYVMNDPLEPRTMLAALAEHNRRAGAFERFVRYSQVMAWVRMKWEHITADLQEMENYESIYDPQSDTWQEVVHAFQGFQAYAAEDGFELLAVVFPALTDYENYPLAPYHEQLLAMLESQGIAYLDLLPAYSKLDAAALRFHDRDAVHPNALGHRIAAEQLSIFLQPYL